MICSRLTLISMQSYVEIYMKFKTSIASICSLISSVVVYNQENINLELEKLRIELRHAQGMHAVAQSENVDASQKVMSFFLLSKHL